MSLLCLKHQPMNVSSINGGKDTGEQSFPHLTAANITYLGHKPRRYMKGVEVNTGCHTDTHQGQTFGHKVCSTTKL